MGFVEINGREYPVVRMLSGNRNAVARLRDGKIVITVPRSWPDSEKERVAASLLKRAVRAIGKGKWSTERTARVVFSHGQRVTALGKEMTVVFIPGLRFGARLRDGKLEVRVDGTHLRKDERAATAARKAITRTLMPELLARVKRINEAHFDAAIRKVSLRDSVSRWGSCSPDGSISLNFRLLFMPEGILDYVIVHELAHTRYKSHGPRFWQLVERIMPDHRQRRRWLRENGWSYPRNDQTGKQELETRNPETGNGKPATALPAVVPGQETVCEYYDEPY